MVITRFVSLHGIQVFDEPTIQILDTSLTGSLSSFLARLVGNVCFLGETKFFG
jgi:hypothetical protein